MLLTSLVLLTPHVKWKIPLMLSEVVSTYFLTCTNAHMAV